MEPVAPETQPSTVVEFTERIKAYLATVFIVGFFALVGVWSVLPPKLPGDTLGIIIGGLISIITAIAASYWGSSDSARRQASQQQKKEN